MASSPRGISTMQRQPLMQVLSDLHLEFGQQYSSYSFPATAPFLLLGGDVGRLMDYDEYLGFMKQQVSRFEKVFLVLGNHEFYGLDYEAGLDTARRLVSEVSLADRVILLHRTRWDDPKSEFTMLGCTLWSAIPQQAYDVVQSKVKDFKNINGWSVEKHNMLHAEEHLWLREQVAQASTRQILVATHHAPQVQGTSKPQHLGNPWTCAFATDLMDQTWDGVRIWVFGHTHYSTEVVLGNGIRLLANQRGYVMPESEGKSGDGHVFDDGLVILKSWEVERSK
ncbi:hypothetical protein CEP54_014930 [Fusarium duplospermum]|uniref:Calcineurin-like phosphoesterase domain-containing protein n=1 Tax=Fusarium duplospermum TaxID=1325734 RepID=A0A428NST2_9HYPO|nr:hypothetical protein CEP54_014930 [Fusarium duplospermum]